MTNTRRQEVAQAAAGLLLVLLVYAVPVQARADTTDEGCRSDEGSVNIPIRDFVRLHEAEARLLAIDTATPSPPPRSFVVKNTTVHGVAKGSVAQVHIKFDVLIKAHFNRIINN